MELVDIYIYSDKVDKTIVFNFINNWLKNFTPEYTIFEYPQYFGDVEFETENFLEMISYVLEDPTRKYRFYLENENEVLRPKGMIFISPNSLYIGIGVIQERETYFLNKLAEEYGRTPIVCYGGSIPDS